MEDCLLPQNIDVDVTTLTPTTPEVMSRQATMNIGTIGHVAHGKSTVVRAISGVQTVRFKNEKERNITIKLGYANAKLYKCEACAEKGPDGYSSYPSSTPDVLECKACGEMTATCVRHVSFVDCPGHDILMATMLNGAAVMDAALLLIAANEECPQPQTAEHLAAVEIMKLKHLLLLQNKVELIKEDACLAQHAQIKEFVKGTAADSAKIIPISAILKYNVDVIVEYMCTQFPIPKRNFAASPEMIVIRSFDVNRPGENLQDLVGGVAGGSILQGVFKLGDQVEYRPGIITRDGDDFKIRPIRSVITSLFAEQNALQYAVPGGLIGLGSHIDPKLCRADALVGQVIGSPGSMPSVFDALEVSYYLLRRLIGVKAQKKGETASKAGKVKTLEKGELLMVNIGSTSVGARVAGVKADVCKLKLSVPVCTRIGDKIAISRRVDKNWRLIGWGSIYKGKAVELQETI